MLSQQCSCRSPALQVMRVEPEMETTLSSENIWPLLTEPAVRPSPPPLQCPSGVRKRQDKFQKSNCSQQSRQGWGGTHFSAYAQKRWSPQPLASLEVRPAASWPRQLSPLAVQILAQHHLWQRTTNFTTRCQSKACPAGAHSYQPKLTLGPDKSAHHLYTQRINIY